MILFQEQMQVRDDTLDPAYFAKMPKRTESKEYDDTKILQRISELEMQVVNLQIEINELKQAQVHQELTTSEYASLSEEEKLKDVEYLVFEE